MNTNAYAQAITDVDRASINRIEPRDDNAMPDDRPPLDDLAYQQRGQGREPEGQPAPISADIPHHAEQRGPEIDAIKARMAPLTDFKL